MIIKQEVPAIEVCDKCGKEKEGMSWFKKTNAMDHLKRERDDLLLFHEDCWYEFVYISRAAAGLLPLSSRWHKP